MFLSLNYDILQIICHYINNIPDIHILLQTHKNIKYNMFNNISLTNILHIKNLHNFTPLNI